MEYVLEDINITSTPYDTSSRLTPTWTAHMCTTIALVSIFVPFILISNIMVIVSVAKFKRLQIPTNLFFTSLATADIVIALALPIYVMLELTPSLRSVDVTACLAANRILMTVGGVSILTLANIAYDRYTAITYPLKYMIRMKKGKILGLILSSWLYSGIICWIPVIFDWHQLVPGHEMMCTNSILDRKSRLLFICAIFTPACALILFFYFKISRVARQHAKAIAAIENSIRSTLERQFVKSDTKYAKTIAIVIGVFVCSWLPYQICLFLTFIGYTEHNQWVNNYLMLLAFFNSGVNPWVYAYQNNDIRTAYQKVWHAIKCHRQTADIEDRRTSIISTISQLSPSDSCDRLNRANSRVVASDILFTLSQQMGNAYIENALNRRLSTRYSDFMAAQSLPVLLFYSSNELSTIMDLSELSERPSVTEENTDTAAVSSKEIKHEILNEGDNTVSVGNSSQNSTVKT